MRRLAVFATFALLFAACGADQQAIVVASDPGEEPSAESEPDAVPTPEEPESGAEPTPEEVDPEDDLASLLLTAEDLPTWEHSGPMDFAAEPVFEAEDCELMNQAWAANTYPGTRTRASIEGATLRNTVVEMEDEAAAAAVLDAADRVWEECVQFAAGGAMWWVEPIGVPDAGMRASGLVLGNGDVDAWVIAYWQRDNAIFLLELNGDRTFDYVQPLLVAAAGRLAGVPVLVPELAEPRARTESTPAPDPPATLPDDIRIPTPQVPPVLAPDDDWRDHELARFVPDAGELGEGWMINSSDTTVYAPAEPNEELASCGLTEPPTLDGIEVTYTVDLDYAGAASFIVNRGPVSDAQAFVDVFRGLPDCDPSVLGLPDADFEITTETVLVADADDAVVTRFEGSSGGTELVGTFVVVRYDDLLIAMTSAGSDATGGVPRLSADDMLAIIAGAAARS